MKDVCGWNDGQSSGCKSLVGKESWRVRWRRVVYVGPTLLHSHMRLSLLSQQDAHSSRGRLKGKLWGWEGSRIILLKVSHIVLCVLETVWVHVCIRTKMGYVSRAHVCILYADCVCMFIHTCIRRWCLFTSASNYNRGVEAQVLFKTQPVSMESSNSNGMWTLIRRDIKMACIGYARTFSGVFFNGKI